MITPEEQEAVLAKAYVPEHSVELMTMLSGGEPFLFEDFLCCRTQRGLIVIGYPLDHEFQSTRFESILERIIKAFRPLNLSLIAPQAPRAFESAFVERSSDWYYTLDLPAPAARGACARNVRKAREAGTIERTTQLTDAHRELAGEFVERAAPPRRIVELLDKVGEYVGRAKDAAVLNVWDHRGRLAAFFVVDLAPANFATYVIGCHSKQNCVPGASDLLVSELIALSERLGKRFIHLGIGVNDGIRAFKEKWGGVPSMPYELCELAIRKPSLWDALLGA